MSHLRVNTPEHQSVDASKLREVAAECQLIDGCPGNTESVLSDVRGEHNEYVFTYRGRPVTRIMNSAWLRAREATGLKQVRVHGLKHTFGRRLLAAGVSFEDRQDLLGLGHRAGRMTTHHSAAELSKLIDAANKVCERGGKGKPELVVLRRLSVS